MLAEKVISGRNTFEIRGNDAAEGIVMLVNQGARIGRKTDRSRPIVMNSLVATNWFIRLKNRNHNPQTTNTPMLHFKIMLIMLAVSIFLLLFELTG